MLMEKQEKLKEGAETRQGRLEPGARGHRAPQRRPLVCPQLGLWRMAWETFEGQGGCSRLQAPWGPG